MKNPQSHDLELAVEVFELMIWKHYLCGVHIDVFIDHKSLQNVSPRKSESSDKERARVP